MNLKFKKLILNNFMSFGNTELNLDQPGYNLIKGINQNETDLAISNGSGKSTIFEGIAWCLVGETIRGSKDVKNMFTNGKTSVEVEFINNGDTYKIIRTKDPSNLKIYINDEDKSGKGIRDTEKLLSEYLPDLTASLLGSVIILGQGLPQRFSNNTPSGRKDVLEKLSKSDFMILDLKNRIAKRKTTLSNLVRSTEDDLLKSNTEIKLYNNQITDYTNKLNALKPEAEYISIIEDLELKIIDLDSNYENILNTHIEKNNDITNITTSLNEIEIQCSLQKAELKNSRAVGVQELTSYINSVSLQINDYLNKISTIKSEIKRLESVIDTCPTCGQKLPDVVKIDTTDLHAQLEQLTAEYNDKIAKKTIATNTLTEYNSVTDQEIKNIDLEFIDKKVNLQTKLQALQKECLTIKTEMTKIQSEISILSNQVENTKNELNILKQNHEAYLQTITQLKEKIENISTYIIPVLQETQDKLNNKLSIINKMNTYITRDFRGYLLSNVINYINDKAKLYCKEVFNTNKIEFMLDGNAISISYDGKEYENLSGGEKVRIDIIIQLAIRNMLCKYLNFSSSILVIDEIFDALDSIGCEKITNLIFKELRDVESIYIITHRADLPISCDNTITVFKDNSKISKIL